MNPVENMQKFVEIKMKQLTDSERLAIAINLLDKRGLEEYACQCCELELDCERNGFHNTPAECEDIECAHCPLYYDEIGRKQIGCPYVDAT